MTTYYSIIRFVPEPVIEEFLNIGIIVATDEAARCSVLTNWKRAEQLSNASREGKAAFEYVRSEMERIATTCNGDNLLSRLPGSFDSPVDGLKHLSETWSNYIQFSPVRSSLKTPDDLLQVLVDQFLRCPKQRAELPKNKLYAIRLAKSALQNALEKHQQEGAFRVISGAHLRGKISPHRHDLVLRNGTDKLAINGVSLELQTGSQIQRDIECLGFRMMDTRALDDEIKLAVVSVGGAVESEHKQLLQNMCAEVDAEFVPDITVDEWANDKVLALI